ncbi:MAG: MFS transporter [marine benthic group bacterium]|nr:MFS transporter [Candidatus Carthagonibacter metallireducens]MCL7977325.1 MFS transporter [Gemmatimonadota bacterium]MCL7979887.1 MFS transporter [Gemmatimonadota bacterium]MCL7981515.1 MFS transporter [Gemmatimonadota bacterium]
MTARDAASPKPPPPPLFRWIVLVVISLAMFGNYYVYDAISPIADLLRDQLGFSDSQIGTLNAIYSFPNIIMVLIGGIIIDRIGVKKATLLFGMLCFIGAAITAATGEFLVMAAGRLVFGLGAESLIVSVTVGIARWFRGRELSFAFGVNLTIARLGSFLALNSPTWAKPAYENWQWPLFITVGFATFCIVGALVYWVLENGAERKYDLGEAGETDRVEWGDLFTFPRSYIWVVLLCVTFYSAIFPFQTFAIKFFQDAHGASREMAGFLSSIITLFSMIFTPLFGLWVDRVGKRSLFMMFGSLLLVPVYLVMAYTAVDLRIPMAVMGIAFSLVPAVMWPSVAYLVEEAKLGTAYGLMTMIQNIGLFGFNWMIGWANDYSGASATNPGGYALGMWIFSVLGFLGFFFAYMLRREEMGPHSHGLETITVQSTRKAEAAGRP